MGDSDSTQSEPEIRVEYDNRFYDIKNLPANYDESVAEHKRRRKLIYKHVRSSENVYRWSSFYDSHTKLIQGTDMELSTAFIHAHDDPRFYYNIREIKPTLVKISNLEGPKTLEFDTKTNTLLFAEDSNGSEQEFMIKFTPEGGFRLFQEGLCLTLIGTSELEMKPCSSEKKQVFMFLNGNNSSIIKPYGEMTYTYEYTIIPKEHD